MLKSVLALTKPRVTAMTVFMAGGGMLLAGSPADLQFALALIGVALSVGCANGLNMAIERDTDGMMVRTSSRPLPSGDLTVQTAVAALHIHRPKAHCNRTTRLRRPIGVRDDDGVALVPLHLLK